MGQTPLHYAARDDNVNVIRILLNYEANPNNKDKVSNSPIIHTYIFVYRRHIMYKEHHQTK